MTTYAIVGAGHAGLGAAVELRRLGFEGRIVMFGKEAHLPYERPPLSKAQLLQDHALPIYLKTPDLLDAQRVEVRTGCAVQRVHVADKTLLLAGGELFAYDKLLLATGGRARTLDNTPGGHHALTLRSHEDSLALRGRLVAGAGRLVIVGAGVIGLEIAASARSLGWQVTVLESAALPMARLLPADVCSFMALVHAEAGVDLRCRSSLTSIESTPEGRYSLQTERGALDADVVVAGIGMTPDLDLAREAGIVTDDAIQVDEYARTSAAHVYAAGDATSLWHPRWRRRLRLESWQHAGRHGAAAARTMVGMEQAYDEIPWSWTDQFDLNVQILGLPREADRTLIRGEPSSRKFVALHTQKKRLIGATLINMGREMRPCKALIDSGLELDLMRLVDPAVSLREYAIENAALA